MFICDTVSFFFSLLSYQTTPLDGGVQLDKSLQNALAPLLRDFLIDGRRSLIWEIPLGD
jgi:hypothetical protein